MIQSKVIFIPSWLSPLGDNYRRHGENPPAEGENGSGWDVHGKTSRAKCISAEPYEINDPGLEFELSPGTILPNSTTADLEEPVPTINQDSPRVSVVTINHNMRDGLAATIESVVAQTYTNVEFLVIDCASVDGSVETIERSVSRIAHWVSEADKGIYDAMNKGVRAATGEWVIFMNAGDRFRDPDAIADVFSDSHADADLVYGHSARWYVREEVEKVLRAESQGTLPLRMNCSHQSLFTRRRLLLERPFSSNLIAADYEFLVRMYVEGKRFKGVDRVIAVNATGGTSDVNRLRSITERARIAMRLGLMTPRRALWYLGVGLTSVMTPYVKRLLPRQLTTWILLRKTIH